MCMGWKLILSMLSCFIRPRRTQPPFHRNGCVNQAFISNDLWTIGHTYTLNHAQPMKLQLNSWITMSWSSMFETERTKPRTNQSHANSALRTAGRYCWCRSQKKLISKLTFEWVANEGKMLLIPFVTPSHPFTGSRKKSEWESYGKKIVEHSIH